ncbi:hypothetical protein GOP47_0024699 [Adiantum capillus-veneris]|nr:hypothetical protein GOP47_0024699 [Adiantum capillus-veneris]
MVSLEALWRPRSRWTVLIAACWVEATAGLSYVFSTYSGALKSELSYDQRHINRLSVAKDLGDTVGLAAGLLCRVLPNWAVLSVGALLILGGYGLLWLLTDHHIPDLPFWLVCILIFIGTNGCTYLDTAALLACIPNFPSNRATAVGILKGFKGLCGAIFNQIYASFLSPDETSFILMLALGPALVMIPLIIVIGPLSHAELLQNEDDDVIFRLLYAAALLLAAYMLSVTLVQDFSSVSNTVNVIFTVVLLLILLLPLPIPKIADHLSRKRTEDDGSLKDPLLESRVDGSENGVTSKPTPTYVAACFMSLTEIREEKTFVEQTAAKGLSKLELAAADMTLRKAYGSINFWLLVLCMFFSLGSGTTAFNNLGQMGQSLGYENTQVFVSMTNIWNFTGRLAGGYFSELSTR